MTERDKEIIIALADCNMNENEVARRLYFHRNGVVYHLNSVKKKTGLDPTNFYDLVKLVGIVRGEIVMGGNVSLIDGHIDELEKERGEEEGEKDGKACQK